MVVRHFLGVLTLRLEEVEGLEKRVLFGDLLAETIVEVKVRLGELRQALLAQPDVKLGVVGVLK